MLQVDPEPESVFYTTQEPNGPNGRREVIAGGNGGGMQKWF